LFSIEINLKSVLIQSPIRLNGMEWGRDLKATFQSGTQLNCHNL